LVANAKIGPDFVNERMGIKLGWSLVNALQAPVTKTKKSNQLEINFLIFNK